MEESKHLEPNFSKSFKDMSDIFGLYSFSLLASMLFYFDMSISLPSNDLESSGSSIEFLSLYFSMLAYVFSVLVFVFIGVLPL